MKNIIRAGFSLTIAQNTHFTRDLGVCVEAFACDYPAKAKAMSQALQLALHPTENPKQLLSFLDVFGSWMIGEASVWLDRHNPHRSVAMKLV